MSAIIQTKDLVLGYKTAISYPLTLQIKQGEWVGIVGQNGIGKSTLFKTLMGQVSPISGTLLINDQVQGRNNHLISYIPQERELITLEQTSGLTLIKASYRAQYWGLPFFNQHFRQKLQEIITLVGIEPYLMNPISSLSGGQRKRIYLAQALINSPSILLLDEPLSDLDPMAKQHFIQALKEIHRHTEITVLIISHDMQEISTQLDRFLHFKDGNAHICEEMPCLKEDARV